MAAVFQLDVLAASVPFFQGKCVSAVIPVVDGEYGVLAGHSNAVGAVCAGELRFETEDGEHRRAAVAPGLFKIDGDRVLLLLDAAEWPEDIDVNRALRARREAEEELRQKRSMAEYQLAQGNLARALNRLRISGRAVSSGSCPSPSMWRRSSAAHPAYSCRCTRRCGALRRYCPARWTSIPRRRFSTRAPLTT